MKGIHAPFVIDPEKDQQAAGHPHRQAEYIQEAVSFMLPEIANRYFEEVPDHMPFFLQAKPEKEPGSLLVTNRDKVVRECRIVA
jgi:hypothetical protein